MSYYTQHINRYNRQSPYYNPRYGSGVGYTTRRFPGRFRTPTRTTGGRQFRRLNRRGLQNFVLNLNEKKYWDVLVQAADSCCDKVAQLFSLTDVPSGTNVNQRVGDKIVMRNLTIKGRIFFDWSDPIHRTGYANECRVRLVVFIWKDDTDPVAADIQDLAAGGDAADACSFMLDHDRKVKRKLLWDHTYDICNDMDSYSATYRPAPGSDSAFVVNKYIDLSKIPLPVRTVNFAATATAGVNKIWILMTADANERGYPQTGPQVRLNCRLSYTDA